MTDVTNTDPVDTPREPDAVLADAIRVLTEAGRLRRPVLEQAAGGGWEPHPTRTEPWDWAEFVTLAVAGAAANIGGVEKALRGRPGSWEADSVRSMLLSTVGEDPAELDRHRTEPLHLVLRPAELLVDLGYFAVYDESQRILQAEQSTHVWSYRLTEDRRWEPVNGDAPALDRAPDEWSRPGATLNVPRSDREQQEYDRLLDLENQVQDLCYESDPTAYGEALRATVTAKAAERGLDVEVLVDVEVRGSVDDPDEFYGPGEQLLEAASAATPLPWSGLTPHEYPSVPAEIVELERAAGRLPHQRLSARSAEGGNTP